MNTPITGFRCDSNAFHAGGAHDGSQGFLGNGVSSAAVEAFSRILAGELGASGIRVICLRPHAIPATVATSHTAEVFTNFA
jgi:NAD(P)-dependent dehydrogenase (short-subunit alcohol dehydrogenase family)